MAGAIAMTSVLTRNPCGVSTESKAYAATCIFLSMLAAQLGWGRSEFNSVRNAFGIAISRPMPNP